MAILPLFSYEGAPAGFKPLDINTLTGVRRFYQDLGDGKTRLVSIQNVQAILDSNAKRQYNARGTLGKDSNYSILGPLIARVPTSVADSWKYTEAGEKKTLDDQNKTLIRNLNDGEYSRFRIAEYNL